MTCHSLRTRGVTAASFCFATTSQRRFDVIVALLLPCVPAGTISRLCLELYRDLMHRCCICLCASINLFWIWILNLNASFHHHMWIQTRVTVRKRLSWVVTSVTLTFDPWPRPFARTSFLSLVITPENSMMIRWWEHSQQVWRTDGQTDRGTDGQTDHS